MSKPVDVPYTKADVLRAFKIFADEGAPPGCISADTLEKAVVSAGLRVATAPGTAGTGCFGTQQSLTDCMSGVKWVENHLQLVGWVFPTPSSTRARSVPDALKQACVLPPLGIHHHLGLGPQWGER